MVGSGRCFVFLKPSINSCFYLFYPFFDGFLGLFPYECSSISRTFFAVDMDVDGSAGLFLFPFLFVKNLRLGRTTAICVI